MNAESESEERYRRLVEVSPDGIFVFAEGRIVFANSAAVRMLGAESEAELLELPALEVVHSESRVAFLYQVGSASEQGQAVLSRQMVFVDRQGRRVPVESSTTPIAHQGGPATLCVVRDITERLGVEERLRQAQKMEAVGRLTSGVAHDFNNLLAMIQGNAELLGDQVGIDDPRLQAIMRASRRGAELVQRLLTSSRRRALRPMCIDLARHVGTMAEVLQRAVGPKVRLEIESLGDPWPVETDPVEAENAILNLALNARDAMPQGGALTIGIRNVTVEQDSAGLEAGRYVALSVADVGEGMTMEVRDQAFEPFFTTKEVGQGSGLGLSVVYGFARQSGGHVVIDSEVGRGTTVTLYLPKAASGSPAAGGGEQTA